MESIISPLWMFPFLFAAILVGVHVAFAMMGTALLFGALTFGSAVLFQFASRVEDLASSFVLAAIPLFVFMGSILERSGIAENLFKALQLWTRKLPGGLALGTMLLCVLFAASTGVVGATEALVGLLAVGPMMQAKYNKPLIAGTICAGGSLGVMIPPSLVIVILGPLANVSIGDLIFASVFPGLLLAGLYLVYIALLCRINPVMGPPAVDDSPAPMRERIVFTLQAFVAPVSMILLVLGSMVFGWASPTEAAGLGAMGSVLLSAASRRLSLPVLSQAVAKTLTVTSMILLILLGGNLFTGVFVASGGASIIDEWLLQSSLGPWPTIALLLMVGFLGGMFLDWISVTLLVIPIAMPIIARFGVDPILFCVAFMLIVQTSYLTPPMAPAIFYFRGISPPEITYTHMCKGVVPFILIQLLTLALVLCFPEIALWLPRRLLGFAAT